MRRGHANKSRTREPQRDLRALGYLRRGIDGAFGAGTERGLKALQHDLLNNSGESRHDDGDAAVAVINYNQGRVVDVTGVADQGTLGCIIAMIGDQHFPKLPFAEDPRAANKQVQDTLQALSSAAVPIPFLLPILKQESGLKHFNVPRAGDDDTFITVGLDTNAAAKHVITSRGYGAGQYTLFHHPPKPSEVQDFMLNPSKNLSKAVHELRHKFEHFVTGATSGTRADDRFADAGPVPLRECKYDNTDARFMRDCKACMHAAGTNNIERNVTRLYAGSQHRYRPTQYYKKADYADVPIRKKIECDWPYAARRYNGSGINSYHYQVRILKNVLRG